MSVVSLAGGPGSNLRAEDLHRLAAELNIKVSDKQDAEDYLLLLRSLESVLQHVKDGPDYIVPALRPQPTVNPRKFWKPEAEQNPLNAWSHRCEMQAASPRSDLLKNRTVAIKDNISVGGLPTTLGTFPEILSRDGRLPISPIDATVVARILAAGAVVKGTSTCENYCASPLSFSSATGPVDNPLLPGYTAGGSSSGSCALVASHVLQPSLGSSRSLGETAELAIGGDQAGSVRNPASYNGIYGLKPTFGLVPYTGAVSMSPMLDHLGPIASTLEDIAILLKVMAGYDGLDARMTPESPQLHQVKDYPKLLAEYRDALQQENQEGLPVLKVGLLVESFSAPGLSTEVRDTVRHGARAVFEAAGAEVVDVSVPMHSEGPIIWTAATRASMSDWLCQGKTGGHLSFLPPHIQPQWPPNQDMYDLLNASNPGLVNIIFSGQYAHSAFGAALEAKAHRRAFQLREAYDTALQSVDVLIAPCAPTVAMPHPCMTGTRDGDRSTVMEKLRVAVGLTSNTCPFNITGHPSMSVPCGSSSVPEHPEVQLPIGMQIIGKRWDDETVLRAAALFEHGKRTRELETSCN